MTKDAVLELQRIKLADVKLHPRNPRIHSKPGSAEWETLKASLVHDYFDPLILNTSNNMWVSGHLRAKVLLAEGYTHADVVVKDYDEETHYARMIAANKQIGTFDFPELKNLLEGLDTGAFNMDLTGFTMPEIEDLMNQFNVPEEGLTPDDAIPEKVDPICKTGDLWQLGDHRLLCGDATVITDVEKLMGSEKAEMVFTDPPYGDLKMMKARKEVATKVGQYQEYPGHGNFDFLPCWEIIKNWECKKIIWGGNYFAHILPITTSWLVWDKRAGEHSFFSDCELAWTNLGVAAKICSIIWQGMIREGEHDKRLHPTQKPIALASRIIEGQLILDLFGGSGSTLIACEKLGRKCYMMEIDQHYCDVIIKRWEDYTGRKAELTNDN